MNITKTPRAIFRLIYRYALRTRWLLSKPICKTFAQPHEETSTHTIEHIYVINLDRQLHRWEQIKQELSYVLDASKLPLNARTTRISAVDARQFETTINVDDVTQTYSLREQLFVDPRRLLPGILDLDEKIEMSRQEVAVALSHIKTWRKIASGHHEYVLVLEDDVYFKRSFAHYLDKIWEQLFVSNKDSSKFDILYLSFQEVDLGAEKIQVSENVFRLFRGIWYLSGYVLSKRGAEKLLSLLPVRGPVDLWINHKFNDLNALVTSKSVIDQRIDERSENSYSVLPILSKIGVLNSEGSALFQPQPLPSPVFAIGMSNPGLTSLSMALSMLGYRCCSDFDLLPTLEENRLLSKDDSCIFDAYINIGSLKEYLEKLADIYPEARLILVIDDDSDVKIGTEGILKEKMFTKYFQITPTLIQKWSTRTLVLPSYGQTNWKLLCEFLSSVPPVASYPKLPGRGQRKLNPTKNGSKSTLISRGHWLKADNSPWIIKHGKQWQGLSVKEGKNSSQILHVNQVEIIDFIDQFDDSQWYLREDTFQGNLALFSPSNFFINNSGDAKITILSENMGVRQYSSGALTTRSKFLYGRFEAVLKPPKVAGLVTGVFLHRDSPRQEIDIEFLGNASTKMLVNVYYNPGDEGARFDYGYRGTPVLIDLGFDTTTDFHTYTIEWEANEIRWFVDDKLVHTRVNWAPTPIPHLPMKFHVNLWPSQSRELAGKLANQLLPASVLLRSVRLLTTNLS